MHLESKKINSFVSLEVFLDEKGLNLGFTNWNHITSHKVSF
jgi:hypothetical protein